MKATAALLTMTALAMLAGCNRGSTNTSANASNNSSANSANATATTAPAAPGGTAIDRTFLVGSWGSAGDCSRTLTFMADGTANNSADPEVARWTLEGETLTVTPPNQPPQPGRAGRSGDNLVLYSPTGQAATLTRCGAPATSAAAGGPEAANSAAKEEAEGSE